MLTWHPEQRGAVANSRGLDLELDCVRAEPKLELLNVTCQPVPLFLQARPRGAEFGSPLFLVFRAPDVGIHLRSCEHVAGCIRYQKKSLRERVEDASKLGAVSFASVEAQLITVTSFLGSKLRVQALLRRHGCDDCDDDRASDCSNEGEP
jgi:hypothetical protein